MKIDKHLNKHVGETWWHNADMIIAEVIWAAAKHIRTDGSHVRTPAKTKELRRLENLAKAWATDVDGLDDAEREYFMALLSVWMPKLWD